ncbi:MAG: metallophosphoesterase family protein [Ruminococcus sp.]|uniref:metallophosphoesterase family protein n=1 Tax=Ruminococcus sp. TaxID=41978 RepID=UPI0025D45CDA|nr:metallophosphoesterase [Ruminococcus sp.]MBR5682032.1 metallophosphoesterase family protein [Ruminococcus sp.]
MKIAVFSDIHGNLRALKAVLERIKAQAPDKTVFLGDIFQRGNEESECLELLKSSDIVCLKGNCELYAEHGVDVDPDVEHLREYYDGVRKRLTAEQMEFIRKMPLFFEIESHGHKLHFSHFLFLGIEKPYPFLPLSSLKNGEFDKACESGYVKGYDLAVVGHCHENFVKGNVVSVSASGLEGASWLLIEVNGDSVDFERFSLDSVQS